VDRLGPLTALARPLGGLDRRLRLVGLPRRERYASMMSHFDREQMTDLCRPEFLAAASAGPDPWSDVLALPRARGVDRYGLLDTSTYLPGAVLTKVDRMSMAHSLEVRSPLLDHRVYELAARLPSSLKLARGTTKWLLRRLALKRGMPEDLVLRRKQGFGVPVGEWFRSEQRDWVTQLLLDERSQSRGYFETAAVRRLLDDHIARRVDYAAELWTLAMLELWHRQFIDAG